MKQEDISKLKKEITKEVTKKILHHAQTKKMNADGDRFWKIREAIHCFIWIGTHGGLNRYDGYSFRVF
jgi:hypothetical protein